jgi:hypothetical protein
MGAKTDRARRALDAMKLLGFSKKQATPVLRRLLKIFNDNWEPIEDECYRALADAILDAQDDNQTPASQQVMHSPFYCIASFIVQPYQQTSPSFYSSLLSVHSWSFLLGDGSSPGGFGASCHNKG